MAERSRKYLKWGEFLRKRRVAKYRSAREFCSRADLGISYPQYSRYEAGDQLPSLEQAVKIFELLQIPVAEGVLHWCLAQVKDSKKLEPLTEAVGAGGGKALQPGDPPILPAEVSDKSWRMSMDHTIVFNRAHLELFQSHPAYRDIFTYVNSYAREWMSAEEVARALGLNSGDVQEMLRNLVSAGITLHKNGKYASTKSLYYFPNDQDYFGLRNQNFMHNVNGVLARMNFADLEESQAYRGLVTRQLTREQVAKVNAAFEDIKTFVISRPDGKAPDAIYSVCMLLGRRFNRFSREEGAPERPGLKSQPETEAKAESQQS